MHDLQQWLSQYGFMGEAVLDNKPHRFQAIEDRDGEKNGWYVGTNIDGLITCSVGDWSVDGNKAIATFRSGRKFNPGEKGKYHEKLREAQRKAEEEIRGKQEEAAREAERIWNSAGETGRKHPYLERKGIASGLCENSNIKESDGVLLIPMRDIDGKLWGIQRIWPDGTKRFLQGQRKAGTFFVFGERNAETIALCEGFATAASVFMATGVSTYAAFDAGNLIRVAAELHKPGKRIIVCGDDDIWSNGKNIGREKAEAAAKSVGGVAVFPEFKPESLVKVGDFTGEGWGTVVAITETKPTDFNDLYVLEGVDEVRRQIEKCLGRHEESGRNEAQRLPNDGVPSEHADSGSQGNEGGVDEIKRARSNTGAHSGDANTKSPVGNAPHGGDSGGVHGTGEGGDSVEGDDNGHEGKKKRLDGKSREFHSGENAAPSSGGNTEGESSSDNRRGSEKTRGPSDHADSDKGGSQSGDHNREQQPPSDGVSGEKSEGKKNGEKEKTSEEKAEAELKRQKRIEAIGKEILDCRFKLYVDNEATILYNITNISKKEVAICLNEEVLLRRLRANLEEKTKRPPREKYVKEVYNYWRLSAEALRKQPLSFSWKDQDEWSFKRLDFIPIEGDYEAWWEFLSRLSCKEDFMAFIWSIFEPKNTSRQFLWLSDLHGEGGKSTVISVLAEIFGDSFEALNNTNTGQSAKWLMGQLYGKRLTAWPDCKNPQFCMSEIVRNITSGDWVTVEMKGQPLFSTKMYMKLIVGSNYEPSITGGGADTSRLIHLKLEQGKIKDDPTWADRLRAELPYFLHACRKVYGAKCLHHGKISLSESTKEHVEDASGTTESKYEEIAESRIIFGEGLTASVKQFHDLCKDEEVRDNFEVGNFKTYLRRKGVTLRRPGTGRPRLYYGMNITSRV